MKVHAKSFLTLLTLRFVIAITLVLFIFSVLINSLSFERFIFKQAHLAETAERHSVQTAIRAYLKRGGSLSETIFTEREIIHMQDVRVLIIRERALAYAPLIALLIIFSMSSLSLAQWRRSIRQAMLALLGVVVTVGIISVSFFDQIFTTFHELLFRNDFWLLDPAQSALIRAYPPEFFEAFFLFGSIGLVLTAALVLFMLRNIEKGPID